MLRLLYRLLGRHAYIQVRPVITFFFFFLVIPAKDVLHQKDHPVRGPNGRRTEFHDHTIPNHSPHQPSRYRNNSTVNIPPFFYNVNLILFIYF